MNDYLSVGYVIKPHGVRGQLKVEPLTDDLSRMKELKHVFTEQNGVYTEHVIEGCGFQPSLVLLKLKGVDSMNAAESFRGTYLWIPRSEAKVLEEDAYYWADLMGCQVVFSDSKKQLGVLDSILETKSNDIYVVKTQSGKEVLLPALKQYITVDMEHRTVWVHREGLEEILPDED